MAGILGASDLEEEGSAGRVRAVFGVWVENEGGRGKGAHPFSFPPSSLPLPSPVPQLPSPVPPLPSPVPLPSLPLPPPPPSPFTPPSLPPPLPCPFPLLSPVPSLPLPCDFPLSPPMQIGLRTIWEEYYEESHAVIYVVDAACPNRFDDARGALGGC
ncbi:unnamed protein product [Closterium sp. NIES-64]|nr:unnamed protein product [Closterium sp. NIES-64]